MSEANSLSIAALLQLLDKAQKAVPAVKYALGLVGIAAAAGIVSILLGHTRTSVILLALMFAGMFILFLFARLVSSGASSSIQLAANVVMWTIVLVFSCALIVGFLAVAIRWPPGVVEFLFPNAELSNADLLQRVVTRDSLEQAEDAVRELSRRCEVQCADSQKIVKTLTTVLQNTAHLDRDLNRDIVMFLKKLTNNDLQSVLNNELESREFLEVDFSNANLSGLSFKNAFIVLTTFRNANLSNVDLSETDLRGSDFRGAVFNQTSLEDADWYNSFNLNETQLAATVGSLLKCPSPFNDPAFSAFIKDVNDRYGIHYDSYTREHQHQLKDQWQKYGSPNGLCEMVGRR